MEEDGCLSYQILCLKTSSVWPLQTKNKIFRALHNIYTFFTCVLLATVSLSLLAATVFSRDLKNISSTVDILTLTLSALYKLLYMKIYMKRFQTLVRVVHSKFKNKICNKNGDFIDVNLNNKICKIYSTLLILSGTMASVCWVLAPMLETGEMENIGGRVQSKRFPLSCWIPFDAGWSPIYEIIYVLEGLSFFFGAHIYLTGDSFFFMLIYQVSVQLEMLSKMMALNKIKQMDFLVRDIHYKNEENDDEWNVVKKIEQPRNQKYQLNDSEYQAKLKECVAFHQTLLWTMTEIEQLYRSMILADVLHAIISLTFALFETGSSESTIGLVKMYFFLLVCIVHQFLNSHYGQMLLNAQEQVFESAYNSQWYKSSAESRKYMILILARSRKFTVINGGKMYNLCRASFVLFSKTLFSYYMFLRQVTE